MIFKITPGNKARFLGGFHEPSGFLIGHSQYFKFRTESVDQMQHRDHLDMCYIFAENGTWSKIKSKQNRRKTSYDLPKPVRQKRTGLKRTSDESDDSPKDDLKKEIAKKEIQKEELSKKEIKKVEVQKEELPKKAIQKCELTKNVGSVPQAQKQPDAKSRKLNILNIPDTSSSSEDENFENQTKGRKTWTFTSSDESDGEKDIICNQCNITLLYGTKFTKRSYKEHQKLWHSTYVPTICNKCNYRYDAVF